MKNVSAILLSVILCVVALTACGSSAGEETTPGNEVAGTEETTSGNEVAGTEETTSGNETADSQSGQIVQISTLCTASTSLQQQIIDKLKTVENEYKLSEEDNAKVADIGKTNEEITDLINNGELENKTVEELNATIERINQDIETLTIIWAQLSVELAG
jgi:predicted RNase H-like nuclease (RuvC/YqgF family)